MGVISSINSNGNSQGSAFQAANVLGKDDFLKLLITKLTNQDPLKPMDDESFVAELAQFSSLEQMQNINDSLSSALQWDYLQMQTINNTMATSLIGRSVTANYSGVYLDEGTSPVINFTTDKFAASATVKILDADGNLVRTLRETDLPPGVNSFKWDGKDDRGNRAESGYYTIEVSAVDAAGEAITPSTFVSGKVSGVVYHDGAAFLKVNGLEIALADVSAIDKSEE